MDNKELIKCVEAAERGEKIEVRVAGSVLWEPKANTTHWNTREYEYRIAKPAPKLLPHWPAIWHDDEGRYYVTDTLFHSKESARDSFSNFVRLVTEYPPIMLEVKE